MTAAIFDSLSFRYDHAGRPPIIEAASLTLAAYRRGDKCIGHDLPPRIGKSTLIHILAAEFEKAGAPFTHVVTPWTNLSEQLVSEAKIVENLTRVKAHGYAGPFLSQAITAIDSAKYWDRRNDSYTLIASTIHLASFNSENVRNGIAHAYELTGARPVIVVDEVHLVAEGQKWSDLLLKFQAAGAFIVTMTGTAGRTDEAAILGFESIPETDWEQKEITVITKRGIPYIRDADDLLVRMNKKQDQTLNYREVRTKATGLTIGWALSFEEGWMHLVSAQPQDFQVALDGEPVWISKVDASTAQKNLGRWMRSSECCRQLASKGIEWLSKRRADERMKHTKMLVVTASDYGKKDDKDSNAHAREMRRQIENAIGLDPLLSNQDLSIEICTSVSENGETDDKALEKIKRFGLTKTDKEGNEPIDVLIVKGMGLVGLDVPQCKILLDASTFRRGPIKKQLATRPLTVWTLSDGTVAPDAQIAYPVDPLNHDFYSSLTEVSNRGSEKIITDKIDYEEEAEVKDPVQPVDLIDGTGKNLGYLEEGGKWAEGDYDKLIARIQQTWPETLSLRRITLIAMHQSGAFPEGAMSASAVREDKPTTLKVRNLSDELKDEKTESFGAMARSFISKIHDYKTDTDRWRNGLCVIQGTAKKRCLVSPDEPVDKIQDPELLRKLKDALRPAFADYMQSLRQSS